MDLKKIDKENDFIREPVEEVCRKIEATTTEPLIVLGGGRGCGKTTVLEELENRSIARDDKFISMRFDSVGASKLSKSEEENLRIQRTRIEMDFCSHILHFIKSYYKKTYFESFSDFESTVRSAGDVFSNYLRKFRFDERIPQEFYNIENKLAELLNMFCDRFKGDISVGVDRFDWTDAGSKSSQEIIFSFLPLFDKAVITTDDMEVAMNDGQNIKNRGFIYMEPSYGKDLFYVREIIKAFIEGNKISKKDGMDTESRTKAFREKYLVSDAVLNRLIEVTNGNISMIKSIIKEADTWRTFDLTKSFDEVLELAIRSELNQKQKIDAMGTSHKLHI